VFVAEVLPRHTFTAALVWQWLVKLLAGLSSKAAAEQARLPFTLEAVYRLRRSLGRRLEALRTRLAPGNARRPTARRPIPCCKRRSISGRCSPAARVRRRTFNCIINTRCWVEAPGGEDFARIATAASFQRRFPGGRQHDPALCLGHRVAAASPA
jgi:hypothetical protein